MHTDQANYKACYKQITRCLENNDVLTNNSLVQGVLCVLRHGVENDYTTKLCTCFTSLYCHYNQQLRQFISILFAISGWL